MSTGPSVTVLLTWHGAADMIPCMVFVPCYPLFPACRLPTVSRAPVPAIDPRFVALTQIIMRIGSHLADTFALTRSRYFIIIVVIIIYFYVTLFIHVSMFSRRGSRFIIGLGYVG